MFSACREKLLVVLTLGFLLVLAACGTSPTVEPDNVRMPTEMPLAAEPPTDTPGPTHSAALPASPTPTNTPTAPAAASGPTATTLVISRCQDATGELGIRVMAGPGEAVGLEPFAIGKVPFTVTTNQASYQVTGGGPVTYADVLVEDWGTYDVYMDLDFVVDGECLTGPNGEQLELMLDMAGEQMVKVDAGQFQGEYPWSGLTSLPVILPLEDGASATGEGWAIVLHLLAP